MKKCLFIATVTEHIVAFHIPYLKWFKEQGWEVHVATNGEEEIPYCDKKHNIAIQRSPFRPSNLKAYFQLKTILANEKYDIIHGHTPMGGILARLCGRRHRKTGTRVMYTAHGFHFYKGAPLINWLLYYPMEKWMSKYTDALITMNNEDYEFAKRKMNAKKLYYIPGIGVDTEKFSKPTVDRETKRKELGIPIDATVVISVGELIKRKNHQTAIKAISMANNDKLYYVICGRGELERTLHNICKELKIKDHVFLLGYRTDIVDLLHMSDIFLFPSIQEGLPVAMMEAMAAGLPCVVSKIRGNVDLVEHGKGGYLCEARDVVGYLNAIREIMINTDTKHNRGEINVKSSGKYNLSVILEKMKEIYEI